MEEAKQIASFFYEMCKKYGTIRDTCIEKVHNS